MSVARITDHAGDAVDRLLQQYQARPRLAALLRAYGNGVQKLEDALAKLIPGRSLFGGTAKGAQLDGIGKLVGLARNGASDALYYLLLIGAAMRNNTDATLASIESVALGVFQANRMFLKTPSSYGPAGRRAPASISLGLGDVRSATEYGDTCRQLVQDSLGAGISIGYISRFPSAGTLSCAGPQSWVAGLANAAGQGGGKLAGVIYSNRGQ